MGFSYKMRAGNIFIFKFHLVNFNYFLSQLSTFRMPLDALPPLLAPLSLPLSLLSLLARLLPFALRQLVLLALPWLANPFRPLFVYLHELINIWNDFLLWLAGAFFVRWVILMFCLGKYKPLSPHPPLFHSPLLHLAPASLFPCTCFNFFAFGIK